MFKKTLGNRKGQGMVEYVLIVALIAIAAIAAVKLFGGNIKTLFSQSANKIQTEGSTAIQGN